MHLKGLSKSHHSVTLPFWSLWPRCTANHPFGHGQWKVSPSFSKLDIFSVGEERLMCLGILWDLNCRPLQLLNMIKNTWNRECSLCFSRQIESCSAKIILWLSDQSMEMLSQTTKLIWIRKTACDNDYAGEIHCSGSVLVQQQIVPNIFFLWFID